MCKWTHLPVVIAFSPLPTVENRCQARRPYRWFSRFACYPRYAVSRAYRGFSRFGCYQRYEIELSPQIPTVGLRVFAVTNGMPPVARTVGFCLFAITNGMKLGCPCRFLPWVFAFSPLPTVENHCQARRPYRGFLRFCHYQRYFAIRPYRGFLHFRRYPRYKISVRPADRTVVFAFSPLPTVPRRSRVPRAFAFLLLPTV